MADNKVVELFKSDDSVERLIQSVTENNPDALFMVGLKDGTIYYGSSNYDSSLYTLGCLEVIKNNILAAVYEES